MSTPQTGKVKHWNDDKGYGFISREHSDDLFVHVSQVPAGHLTVGDVVSFTEGQGRKGPEAREVIIVQPAR